MSAVIEVDVLARLVGGALLAGVGVTSVFALGILGAAKFADARRDGRSGRAGAYALLAALALSAFAAGVVLGVTTITAK